MDNIGPREREIVKQHNLHHSWLIPANCGENCPCCKKLRDFSHYITDAGICVFCSVACKEEKTCQVSRVVESGDIKLDGPVCPACLSSNIEYLCNHWACHNCQWKGRVFEYKLEPPKGINPNENICCDIGDDD